MLSLFHIIVSCFKRTHKPWKQLHRLLGFPELRGGTVPDLVKSPGKGLVASIAILQGDIQNTPLRLLAQRSGALCHASAQNIVTHAHLIDVAEQLLQG